MQSGRHERNVKEMTECSWVKSGHKERNRTGDSAPSPPLPLQVGTAPAQQMVNVTSAAGDVLAGASLKGVSEQDLGRSELAASLRIHFCQASSICRCFKRLACNTSYCGEGCNSSRPAHTCDMYDFLILSYGHLLWMASQNISSGRFFIV